MQQLAIHSVGGVVTSAQPLMVGVPQSSDDPTELTAEMRVANQDIGFVNASQIASVKLAIFPYTKYSTVHAQTRLIHLCEWFYDAHAPTWALTPSSPQRWTTACA